MKPVAWIKIRELSYMKAVAEHGKDDWQTNLGLKPEPDDEGLYTETQVQRMIELLKRCENESQMPQNPPFWEPVYRARKQWQGLTDEEAEQIIDAHWNDPSLFVEAIEAKLKEKNT